MCIYDNALENNEIVIYVTCLYIGPIGQLYRVLQQKHYVGHMWPHTYLHSYILVIKSGNICGKGQRLCLELLEREVDFKLLGGVKVGRVCFIFCRIQFLVETYQWNRVTFSTSLLIGEFELEELQRTNMYSTIIIIVKWNSVSFTGRAIYFWCKYNSTLRGQYILVQNMTQEFTWEEVSGVCK